MPWWVKIYIIFIYNQSTVDVALLLRKRTCVSQKMMLITHIIVCVATYMPSVIHSVRDRMGKYFFGIKENKCA